MEGDARPGRSAPASGAGGGRSWAGLSARCTAAWLRRWPRRRFAGCSGRPPSLRAGGSAWMASDRRTRKPPLLRATFWELRTLPAGTAGRLRAAPHHQFICRGAVFRGGPSCSRTFPTAAFEKLVSDETESVRCSPRRLTARPPRGASAASSCSLSPRSDPPHTLSHDDARRESDDSGSGRAARCVGAPSLHRATRSE
jgi:hypothetical protein